MYIQTIVTVPAQRRRGLATLLLHRICQLADQRQQYVLTEVGVGLKCRSSVKCRADMGAAGHHIRCHVRHYAVGNMLAHPNSDPTHA
jgi:hypothetical protein